jgi:hypothetical protein
VLESLGEDRDGAALLLQATATPAAEPLDVAALFLVDDEVDEVDETELVLTCV